MQLASLRLLCGALLASAAVARSARFQVEPTEGDVLVLDESNFDTTIAEHDGGILVEFFAPWCGHCKKLAPEYKKAATTLMEEFGGTVRLGMVDATEDKEVAERYGVKGFPSLQFFSGGDPGQRPLEYEGGRTASDIVAYMKKKTGSPATLMVDEAQFKRALRNVQGAEVLVGGFFADLDGPAAKLFFAAAAQVDDVEFVYSVDSSLAAFWPELENEPTTTLNAARKATNSRTNSVDSLGGYTVKPDAVPTENGGSFLAVFKSFDERRSVVPITPGATTPGELVRFVASRALPLVVDFSQERTKQLFRGPVKVHVLTFVDPKGSYVGEVRETLKRLAAERRGEVVHVLVPSTEDKVASYFGVEKKDFPLTVLSDVGQGAGSGSMKKYPFIQASSSGSPTTSPKRHDAGELRRFIQRFFDGDLSPSVKSEAPKPGDLKAAVKVVTGESFHAVVGNPERSTDVLLQLYAPWCGHCKALAPVWEELGAKFSGVTDEPVWIAKLDATANEVDHPGVVVRGFPTILFFPGSGAGAEAESNARSPGKAAAVAPPVTYDGGREASDLVRFLVEHATRPFELEDGTKGNVKRKHEEL